MYVIGKNDYEFIKITHSKPMYDGKKIWSEISKIEYDAPLHEATIISDYESAEKMLKEIKEKYESIQFRDFSIIGEILDREHGFDKAKYVEELKIYLLLPTEVSK